MYIYLYIGDFCSEIMSAPVKRIDDIIADCNVSLDEFKNQEIPPSDDDSWLYNGEDELNAALFERQQEMEFYDMKKNKEDDVGPSCSSDLNDYDLGDIAKSMQEFVQKMSSFEGAEVPGNRQVFFIRLLNKSSCFLFFFYIKFFFLLLLEIRKMWIWMWSGL